MSEGKDTDNNLISRRSFLKKAVVLGGAILLTACNKVSTENSKPDFREIETGDTIPLNVSGEYPKNIMFQYANSDISRIQVCQIGGSDTTFPFKSNCESVRMLGEIVEPTLYRLTDKNPSLGSEITVGVYPATTGYKLPNSGRESLNITDKTYALPVIVQNMSYFEDHAPAEINNSYTKKDIPEFGNGLAVGSLNNDVFTVTGFVCDARAVILA